MVLKSRLDRLEKASPGKKTNVAFITYGRGGDTKSEAIAEWEAANGPISECLAVFFTTFEAKPGTRPSMPRSRP
jgi:hypothetical protein